MVREMSGFRSWAICLFFGGATLHGAEYRTFFDEHCVKCHGPKKMKGDLRLDDLMAPDGSPESNETWLSIFDALEAGEMPPSKEPRPPVGQIESVTKWIDGEVARFVEPVPGLRRMNRIEYEYTVQDLLGIDTPLADLLPEDTSVQGFDNVATGLGISSVLMERYLEAADTAFEGVIRRIKPLSAGNQASRADGGKRQYRIGEEKERGRDQSPGSVRRFYPRLASFPYRRRSSDRRGPLPLPRRGFSLSTQ